MKFSLVILFLGVLCNTISAQLVSDAIYTEINGNQITIHQNDAEHNCCFLPDLENIVLSENTISWYQTDTIGMVCGCDCFFNYSVTIDSLNPGNYTAMVYSVYLSDTTFEGSVDFTITSQVPCDHNLFLTSFAGICHEPNSAEDIAADDMVVKVDPDYLRVTSTPGQRILKISLYSISGQEMQVNVSGSNIEKIIRIGSLPQGVYIMSLVTCNGKYTRKIPVFR